MDNLFIVVAVSLLVLGAIAYAWFDKRRKDALKAYATKRGYSYVAEDRELADRFHTRPFGDGTRRRAYDVVFGERDGLRFTTYRYVFETPRTTHDGQHTTDTHTWQATWIELPSALPSLAFSPDNAFLRALGGLGLRDVDVESHDFNQRWRVVAADTAFAHAVLAPTVIGGMLAPVLEDRIVFVEGDALVAVDKGRSDLSDLDEVLDALSAVRDAVPSFVFTDYATGR
ncbi:hypothetical protein [Demequina sp. NBRC 110054]|uniref:hypothetical protein n=1 Tax=Demequina sp. NBRC 110054 TaxID=1570343 RepID=UPI0009FCF984|nr:hypothetical protein [Demequina sp. NBRC 110054]